MSNTINYRDGPIDEVAVTAGFFARTRQPQPTASGLGPRFLPWQLGGTPEQSWAECERHAENRRLLLGDLVDAGAGRDSTVVKEESPRYTLKDGTNNLARQIRMDFD